MIARLAERGIASKAYLPCIHLFPHLRELGYREGQFPVAEAAAAHSLALPFFPAMSEAQVDRVCQELAAALGQRAGRDNRPPDGPASAKTPTRASGALNRSLEFDWRLAPYDIDQSRAHARGLHRDRRPRRGGAGADRRRPGAGARADRRARLRSSRTPTRTSTWRSSACSARRSARWPASSTPAARATTRSRPTWRWSSRPTRCARSSSAAAAMEQLLGLAEAHRDWPMPGYTHLQRAQPVYLGHHLLAYFWMLARDVLRFQFALDSASVMPLGSGALAGVNWEIDRDAVAADLGFDHVSHNSIDGASNRDFVLDYLAAASTCAMHLSRLGSEIVIWSSTEFGFCELDESFSSGSSIMPQKMNPDSAELLRAKSPRVAASYATLLGVMHALPLTYGKDMQEDKEPLFDAIDTVEACLDATAGMLAGIEFDRERMEDASGDEMLAATEVADLLVRRGVPFREAHGIVGGLVRDAVEQGKSLSELTPRRCASPLRAPRRVLLRGAAARQLAGVEADRRRHRLGPARGPDRGGPRDPGGGPGAGPRRAVVSAAPRAGAGSAPRRLLRPLGPPRRPRADRLPALLRRLRRHHRRDRELRARRPRLPRLRRPDPAPRSSSARPAAPTSTSPTGSTACSTSSAKPRARRPRS